MKRNKNLPLTETVFYILLALKEPMHGYLIMQRVEELSKGDVRMAAGTLYGAVENLLKLKFIEPAPSEDKRRKVYKRTSLGSEILSLDMDRMKHMLQVSEENLGGKPNESI
ncbi:MULTISPECIES: PadR family transcriptional regulator [unclassified Fusibacter]|uniref:PadR family transcriptional regulator n=1 Tax=unclassified Fusibacter TaxID=2624464 RepID=UPI001010820B|nr:MULTISPECIES: PadR family transcriptional regulator [unclassified Fusibacter]MCK8059356.1 PadR family transcriptional regulator [Fusibacter sp. A2]NPE21180.1 PadR family transcriptional regulator [Fusibacter sp. A1]RXV62448.1 PadR family transcriptional regulator [Fusibacter sp. A1]